MNLFTRLLIVTLLTCSVITPVRLFAAPTSDHNTDTAHSPIVNIPQHAQATEENSALDSLKQQVDQAIVEMLGKLADREKRIQEKTELKPEYTQQLLSQIGTMRSFLLSQQQAVQQATTVEQVQAATKTIREFMLVQKSQLAQEKQVHIERYAQQITAIQLSGNRFIATTQRIINQLKKNGKNTTTLEKSIADLRKSILTIQKIDVKNIPEHAYTSIDDFRNTVHITIEECNKVLQ